LYVTNFSSDTLSMIDATNNSVIATVNTGTNPHRVVLSHDGKWLYLTNCGGPSVSVIDSSTNAVVATLPVDGLPDGLALTPDDSRILVGSALGGVTIVNTAGRTVTAPSTFSSRGVLPWRRMASTLT
jgi:YVTN family beta-propeller protein